MTPISLRSILILSSHVFLGLHRGVLHVDLSLKILKELLLLPFCLHVLCTSVFFIQPPDYNRSVVRTLNIFLLLMFILDFSSQNVIFLFLYLCGSSLVSCLTVKGKKFTLWPGVKWVWSWWRLCQNSRSSFTTVCAQRRSKNRSKYPSTSSRWSS